MFCFRTAAEQNFTYVLSLVCKNMSIGSCVGVVTDLGFWNLCPIFTKFVVDRYSISADTPYYYLIFYSR
jgi:hypothetical protein